MKIDIAAAVVTYFGTRPQIWAPCENQTHYLIVMVNQTSLLAITPPQGAHKCLRS